MTINLKIGNNTPAPERIRSFLPQSYRLCITSNKVWMSNQISVMNEPCGGTTIPHNLIAIWQQGKPWPLIRPGATLCTNVSWSEYFEMCSCSHCQLVDNGTPHNQCRNAGCLLQQWCGPLSGLNGKGIQPITACSKLKYVRGDIYWWCSRLTLPSCNISEQFKLI